MKTRILLLLALSCCECGDGVWGRVWGQTGSFPYSESPQSLSVKQSCQTNIRKRSVCPRVQRSHHDLERSDRKPARTSSEKSFGCSQAAKCPPLSRSEEHTSELQSLAYLVCRLLLEKKNQKDWNHRRRLRRGPLRRRGGLRLAPVLLRR